MSSAPVHSSNPSYVDGGLSTELPKNKPRSSGFPGVDYLYPATEAVNVSVSNFISHILNGAWLIVKAIAYMLFYPFPFFNPYEAEITAEKLSDILKQMKEGTDSDRKLLDLEKYVHIAALNQGDVLSAKKIIAGFATAEKDIFAKIAEQVLKVTHKKIDQMPSSADTYVIVALENETFTVKDFYNGLRFYRMHTATQEEQFTMLEFQIGLAEYNESEVPYVRQLLITFADVNPTGFKELAACLAELDKEIKPVDNKSVEEAAKQWIHRESRFSTKLLREALDLRLVKSLIARIHDLDIYDKPYEILCFFPPKTFVKELEKRGRRYNNKSEVQYGFMAKAFLERLAAADPELMHVLSMQIILKDETAVNHGADCGLYKGASTDAKWGKKDFDATHYILVWTQDERKFDRDLMTEALYHLAERVLIQGVSDENILPSTRLDVFDRLLSRAYRVSQLADIIEGFVKSKGNEQIGAAFIKAVIEFDKDNAKTTGRDRFIPEQSRGAESSILLAAVLKAAKGVVKKENGVITVFQEILSKAVSHVQASQYEMEMKDKKLEFSKKLEALLLLSTFEYNDPLFFRKMLVALASSSREEFAKFVLYIVDKFITTHPVVKRIDTAAKLSPLHPDRIVEQRQVKYEQYHRFAPAFLVAEPQPLTALEIEKSKQAAYSAVFADHFAPDSITYQPSDLNWLCMGMRSYLTK